MSDRKGQPTPNQCNNRPSVFSYVLKDILDRVEIGRERYGVELKPGNGRDALQDAYEEALDMCMYLKQAIMERDNAGS